MEYYSMNRNELLRNLQKRNKYKGLTQKDIGNKLGSIDNLRVELNKLDKKEKKKSNKEAEKTINNEYDKYINYYYTHYYSPELIEMYVYDTLEKLKDIKKIHTDVIPVFNLLFSRVGTPNQYLQKKFSGLSLKDTNEAMLQYLINDILTLAMHGARDGGYDIIDGYMIWFVVMYNSLYNSYLYTSFIKLKPFEPHFIKMGINKIQMPAFSGLIESFLRICKASSQTHKKNRHIIYDYFNNRDVEVLDLMYVYNELINLSEEYIIEIELTDFKLAL